METDKRKQHKYKENGTREIKIRKYRQDGVGLGGGHEGRACKGKIRKKKHDGRQIRDMRRRKDGSREKRGRTSGDTKNKDKRN